jgi:hypothetical protein
MITIKENSPFMFFAERGKNSALILIKKPGVFSGIPVYVPRDFVSGMKPKDIGRMPMDYQAVPWVVAGEARTANNGEPLLVLQ